MWEHYTRVSCFAGLGCHDIRESVCQTADSGCYTNIQFQDIYLCFENVPQQGQIGGRVKDLQIRSGHGYIYIYICPTRLTKRSFHYFPNMQLKAADFNIFGT